jgi:hypothetical protein
MGTRNARGVAASSLGTGVRKTRVDAGIGVSVAGGKVGVRERVGKARGGKVGAGGITTGGRVAK